MKDIVLDSGKLNFSESFCERSEACGSVVCETVVLNFQAAPTAVFSSRAEEPAEYIKTTMTLHRSMPINVCSYRSQGDVEGALFSPWWRDRDAWRALHNKASAKKTPTPAATVLYLITLPAPPLADKCSLNNRLNLLTYRHPSAVPAARRSS